MNYSTNSFQPSESNCYQVSKGSIPFCLLNPKVTGLLLSEFCVFSPTMYVVTELQFSFGRTLELHLTYSPISLFRWQMYESQRMRQKWFSVFGDEPEQSEEEQDSLKVSLASWIKSLFSVTVKCGYWLTLYWSLYQLLCVKTWYASLCCVL